MYPLYRFVFLLMMGFSCHFLHATYEVVDLGSIDHFTKLILKINNQGTVLVGGETSFNFTPFLYFSKTQEFLSLDILGKSIVQDLNDRDEVLGVKDNRGSLPPGSYPQTFIWSLEKGKIDVTSRIGNTSWMASLCMNDEGMIGGYAWDPVKLENHSNDDRAHSSYIWLGEHTPLICLQNPFVYKGSSQSAVALKTMDDRGYAAGYIGNSHFLRDQVRLDAHLTAFTWDPYSRKMRLLKSLYDTELSSCALDINYFGYIVGASEIPQLRTDSHFLASQYYWHATLWESHSDKVIDCGVVEPFTDSVAHAINCKKQVVGFCFSSKHSVELDLSLPAAMFPNRPQQTGFIWSEKKGMQDLNQLIPDDSQWVITRAFDINNDGQIICLGYLKSENSCYLSYHVLLLNTPESKEHTDNKIWSEWWRP